MKNKVATRFLLVLLAVCSVLSCFAACSNGKSNGTETTAVPDTTPPDLPYELPIKDFDNAVVKILTPQPKRWQFDCEWWYNSDVLNIGLFNRDKKVEETLNCDLNYVYQEANPEKGIEATFNEILTQEQLAQTDTYDLVFHESHYGLDFKGFFYNLNDAELSTVVALDQPFYFAQRNEVSTIDGILVSALSYASTEMMSSATVTIFNHAWWNRLFDGNIYDYVYDGDWTLELMTSMAKEANVDINEDGMRLEEGDKFGLGYMHQTCMMFFALGGQFFYKDTNGDLKYELISDRNYTVHDTLYKLFHDNDCVYVPGYTEVSPAYRADQLLFTLGYFDCARVMKKDGAEDFGFLPIPKLNSSDEYHSVLGSSTAVSIPRTVSDKMNSGILMNAYSYYSFEKVRPAYFDSLLKFQLSKDPDSSYVVDVCMNNLVFDFSIAYNVTLGYLGTKQWNLIYLHEEGQFVSTYLKLEETLNETFTALIEDFKINNAQ